MRIIKAHEGTAYALAFTPDGGRLVTSGRDDRIRVWDLTSGNALLHPRVYPPQYRIAISANGTYLGSISKNGTACLWHTETLKRIKDLASGRDGSIAFSHDGKQFAAAFASGFHGIWELPTFRNLAADRADGIFNCIQFHPGGEFIIGGDYRCLRVWDRQSMRQRDTLVGAVGMSSRLAISPDGIHVAAMHKKVLTIWDFPTRKLIKQEIFKDNYLQSIVFSPDSKNLAVAGNDSIVRFFDTATWTVRTEYSWKIGHVLDVAFASDGLRAAAAGRIGKVVIWDLDD